MNIMQQIRLSHLSHGGGCGCKLAPSVLQQLLSAIRPRRLTSNCWWARERATTPRSGSTITAPASSRPPIFSCRWSTIRRFRAHRRDQCDLGRLRHGRHADHGAGYPRHAGRQDPARNGAPKSRKAESAVCATAGIPVAGGHSIDSPEPVYGLAVTGTRRGQYAPQQRCPPGDRLILTKAIGVGIYSAAIKKGALPRGAYNEILASTTLLNRSAQNWRKSGRARDHRRDRASACLATHRK